MLRERLEREEDNSILEKKSKLKRRKKEARANKKISK
jgi:hypothetical protein